MKRLEKKPIEKPTSDLTNERIISMIRNRLNEGAKEYGDQVPINGTRKHLKDALEEALDLSVYLSAQILELKEYDTTIQKLKMQIRFLKKEISRLMEAKLDLYDEDQHEQ